MDTFCDQLAAYALMPSHDHQGCRTFGRMKCLSLFAIE